MFKKLPSAFFISLCLCGGGITLALDKPAAPQPVDEAGRRIAAETAAAIESLGASTSAKKISTIVFSAVRSSPAGVLPIVFASARVSPRTAVPGIVSAATAAVPNPWKKIIYRRLTVADLRQFDPDGKQTRGGGPTMDLGGRPADPNAANGAQPASGRGAGDPGANSANGGTGQSAADRVLGGSPGGGNLMAAAVGLSVSEPSLGGAAGGGLGMTLAEAIARTAFDAQSGLSLPALLAAVDAALLTDPATLLRNIQSPQSVSGVGDAGLSNYANEPLLTPKQPAVSR